MVWDGPFSQFRPAILVLSPPSFLSTPQPHHCTRSRETKMSLALCSTAQQQLSNWCVVKIVLLLKTKHSIITDNAKKINYDSAETRIRGKENESDPSSQRSVSSQLKGWQDCFKLLRRWDWVMCADRNLNKACYIVNKVWVEGQCVVQRYDWYSGFNIFNWNSLGLWGLYSTPGIAQYYRRRS